MSDYRLRNEEIDLSGFAGQQNNQIAGIVIVSNKGGRTPRFCNRGENQIIRRYGKPDPLKHGVYEAIEYGRVAPLWIACALGSGYKYAGVDVLTNRVVSFGSRAGRVYETFTSSNYSNIERNATYIAASGTTGVETTFVGTINTPLPVIAETVQIHIGNRVFNATINTTTNEITSDCIDGVGTFNVTTGAYNITLNGTPGTPAFYVSEIPILTTVDLSIGGTNKFVNIEIDGALYQNINLGNSATTTKTDIVNAINSVIPGAPASVSGNFIRIDGKIASATRGNIKITPPSNGASAFNLVFNALQSFVSVRNAVSPTGYVPKPGEIVAFNYNYHENIQNDVAFSLFTESPFDDSFETYEVQVRRIGTTGRRYEVILYEVTKNGRATVKTYNFSLDREKNGFGASIYYEDVFKDDDYLKIFVNDTYTNIAEPVVEIVRLSGGNRGNEPTPSDFYNTWMQFQKRNKYECKTFIDPYSINIHTLQTIIDNYQPQAFGISVVPIGHNAIQARIYRQSLGIDNDKLALYTNWLKIEDPYNNTFAWVSGIGKVGVKFAQMNDVFDGLAPAGIDENGRGGQLRGGFRIVDVEQDYTPDDERILDESQINPLIKYDADGVVIMGQKTLQVQLSDTSYIAHRRLFNKIINDVSTLILRKQIFKLNDEMHRLLARTQTETYLAPIVNLNLFREILVQCDENNNNDEVLQNRQFVLDIYVKVTPFSEYVLLRLTRLPQGAIMSDFIQQ